MARSRWPAASLPFQKAFGVRFEMADNAGEFHDAAHSDDAQKESRTTLHADDAGAVGA